MTPDQPVPPEHSFYEFENSAERTVLRELSIQLANYYLCESRSRNGWKNRDRQVCKWEEPTKDAAGVVSFVDRSSQPFTLKDIEQELTGDDPDLTKLGLPNPTCFWLDSSIELSPHFHHHDTTGTVTFFAGSNLGGKFPMWPAVEREGAVFTSFQATLMQRIQALRRSLVVNSVNPGRPTWFEDFRSLVTECVALIDNTLNQIYAKAEFDPEPGWRFDPTELGDRHGRRMVDKIKWVQQITGKELHARDEIRAFTTIRELRNHLQHFDPPSFAFTFEEATSWLNAIPAVAQLAWKIRRCAGALPSMALARLMLQRRARFVPMPSNLKRAPHPAWSGYGSTTWRQAHRPNPDETVGGIILRALPAPRIRR